MLMAKVFGEDNQSVGSIDYCIDGLHVHLVTFLGSATSRKVTPCDNACQDVPIIRESPCSENVVEALRAKLGREAEVLRPALVM